MKRSPLVRKTPLKRGSSQLKRKTPLSAGGKLSMKIVEREAYLRRFRGQPCEICKKTRWGNQKSTAHHILKAELYPQHYFEDGNRIILCPVHHVPFAHDHESAFLIWLKHNKPEQFAWVEERRHHRRES